MLLSAELPEAGDDGADVGIDRRAVSAPTDLQMATMLGMEHPETVSHAEIIEKLSGPSPIDLY